MMQRLAFALAIAGALGLTEAKAATVACSSVPGGRTHCPADTSAGVVLGKPTGEGACILGKTWGYDDEGIWVSDGCGGDFVVAGGTPASEQKEPSKKPKKADPGERPSWGIVDTAGQGFVVHRSEHAELVISGYALVRYINQLPAEQQFTDHLGNVRNVDTRNDLQFHRAMIHFRGWLGNPKFRYQITSWTVMSTDQSTLYGFLGYQFHEKFNLYAGINSMGGSRSLYGSHPFWLANDRVMADEYFRGGFTSGIWANGEIVPGLWYNVAAGNNLSSLGITAAQLDRGFATGGSMWWMPTTHEFGPNGSWGDWEYHEKVATRFGFTTARSKEDRQELADQRPENTQVRLADSLLLFETGSLAPGVTVDDANFRVLSIDAGMKYKGLFVQAELYQRWLDDFDADGALPVSEIVDKGFYVQVAGFPIKKKLEVYGATSWIYGDDSAGFDTSHEYLVGANAYWFNSRNIRSNLQVMHVERSAASSTFGFYVGGQTGTTVSVATSLLF